MVVVFFGRQRTFRILHMYLAANLRTNGGLIDEVLLIPNTHHVDDTRYMNDLLSQYPWYRKSHVGAISDLEWERALALYGHFYVETVAHKSTVYLKIDDDIVHIGDGAIETLVRTKLSSADHTSPHPLFPITAAV